MVEKSRKQNQNLRRNGETITSPVEKETSKDSKARDISEHNQTLKALKESEERFSQLFHSSTAAFAITGIPDGVFIDINEAYQLLTGFSRKELIGHTAGELNLWIDIKQRENLIRRLSTEGQIRNEDVRGRAKNGKLIDIVISMDTINLHGQPFVLSTAIDITERKKAEALLRESEEKYRTLFLNMTEEVSFWKLIRHPDGRIKTWELVDANPPVLRTWGRQSLKEIKGRTTDEIFGPRSTANHIHMIERIMSEGIPQSYEDYFPNLGKYLRLTTVPLGEYFITTGVDITGIKRVEDELETKVRERTLELRESEEKYRSVVDNAFEVILVAQDGCIKFMNKKGLEMTGYTEEEVTNQSFLAGIHPDYRQLVEERYHKHLEGKAAPASYELRMISKDGTAHWAQINTAKILWEGKPAILSILTDITQQKLAQEALRLSEEQYRSLVDNANEGVSVFQDGITKFTNKKGLEINGYSMEELANKPVEELIHPDDRQSILESYQRFMRGEAVRLNYEFRIIRKDGSTRWLQMNVANTTWAERPAILTMFTDITEHKMMDQALQNFSQRLIKVQEEERKRIAYELHDDTAQYLSILKMQLGALLQSGSIKDPKTKEKLQYLENDASRAFQDVRRYSHELRPVILERSGLQAALEQLAEDHNKLGQLQVKIKVGGEEPELTEELKLTFFRIAQEALNNSRKHSRASGVNITLNFRDTNLEMIVSDNGIGFNVGEATAKTNGKGSLGLMSMRERADLIKADLKIESGEGKGTRVILRAGR